MKNKVQLKIGDKVAVPTQKTYCNPYTLDDTLSRYEGKIMVAEGFGIVDNFSKNMRNGKETIDVHNSNSQFVGTFHTEDLVPYEENTEKIKFKVGDLVEIPTTKSRGTMCLTAFLSGLNRAVYGKITAIDAFNEHFYVEVFNKDNESLGGARFGEKDLVLKPKYVHEVINKISPGGIDLPDAGDTPFDIILNEYRFLDLFLASKGYGKSAAMWNELNNMHQQQENNKNALTILALRS